MPGTGLFNKLCIRADASAVIGIGHVMRGLALAQAWRDLGGTVRLIASRPGEAVRERMEREGVAITALNAPPATLEDMEETAGIVLSEGAGWLALDGYHFGKDYRAGIKAAGLQLLVLDDMADGDLSDADIILNPNAYASPALYAGAASHARLLLGPEHALLRREFLPWRTQGSAALLARNIIVTLGGADPENVTGRIIEGLGTFTAWRLAVTVVAGAANPHLGNLRAALPMLQQHHDAQLVVNPPDLPDRMSRADLAITAAGGTCWELAYLGVPMLATAIADNQARVAREIAKLGMAEVIAAGTGESGWTKAFEQLAASQEQRTAMKIRSQALVDGHGAQRVAEALATHPVTLRRATESDARLLWEWVNDPLVRQSAFCTDPISWEDHQRWFARKLNDPDCVIFIGLDSQGQPVGQVRFEGEGSVCVVDVSIARDQRHYGYGAKLLRRAALELFTIPRWRTIKALIKPENAASRRSFARAGFHCADELESCGRHVIGCRFPRPWG